MGKLKGARELAKALRRDAGAQGFAHIDVHRDWPETSTTGACCMGSAAGGPSGCTCWTPEYDVEQAALTTDGPLFGCRTSMCQDCAFRPGSPERTGDPDAAGDEELLDDLVATGEPFWCHQGMRRPVRYRHPSGVVVDASPLEYAPPVLGRRPFKADGSPGDLCFGWAARRAKFIAGEAGASDDA